LLRADDLWGLAALLWIASGLARVFWGGREAAFYWSNGFFWVKLAVFGVIVLMELSPMIAFIRARAARRRGATPLPFPVQRFRIINSVEIALVVVIAFVAPFMARGAWLF
jgi:putative membrane protein